MNNVLVILRKEIKGYFVSPIAYALMAFYGIMAGYFCYVATAIFVQRAMESTMMGRGMPMSVNEWVIRPVLSNVQVLALFLIPMITMRLFAEEKRSGTIELLVTSPITDLEIILGKWLGAMGMYCSILLVKMLCLSKCILQRRKIFIPFRTDSNNTSDRFRLQHFYNLLISVAISH